MLRQSSCQSLSGFRPHRRRSSNRHRPYPSSKRNHNSGHNNRNGNDRNRWNGPINESCFDDAAGARAARRVLSETWCGLQDDNRRPSEASHPGLVHSQPRNDFHDQFYDHFDDDDMDDRSYDSSHDNSGGHYCDDQSYKYDSYSDSEEWLASDASPSKSSLVNPFFDYHPSTPVSTDLFSEEEENNLIMNDAFDGIPVPKQTNTPSKNLPPTSLMVCRKIGGKESGRLLRVVRDSGAGTHTMFHERVLPVGAKVKQTSTTSCQPIAGTFKSNRRMQISDCVLPEFSHSSKFYEEHMATIEEVTSRLQAAGFKIKPLKCEWAAQQCDFLGHLSTSTPMEP